MWLQRQAAKGLTNMQKLTKRAMRDQVYRGDLDERAYCLIRECSRRLIVVAMRNCFHRGL